MIEEATIFSLNELSKRPYSKDALISELNINGQDFDVMLDYGENAHYLGRFMSQEQDIEVIWTPLYWAGKIDDVIKFVQKQNEVQLNKVGSLAEQFKKYPGTPIEKVRTDVVDLVYSGIHHGFFPSVAIKDRQAKVHEYVFSATPQFEVDPKKDIYEKARLLVACIRHGQYHAEITKILYPRSILQAMRTNQMKPHPYANIQYAVLVLHGIVRLEQTQTRYGKAYRVVWIDTPENNLAADIADQLLLGEEVIGTSKEELEARKILLQGVYSYSSELRKLKTAKEVVAKKEFDRIMEIMSGVRL